MRKIFRRTFLTLIIVIFALSAAIVGAKIQMYTATGEDYANEVESQDIAKLRARDKAIKKATKQAGVYLKTYSRSVNSELTDDEVTAITSNAWQLVSEPKYSSEIKKLSDETSIIIWTATVEVNVDDSELQSWIKRDDKDKSTIITQTREAQKSSKENERKIEDLREKYNRATSQAEKDSLRKQMSDADRDFLANQKLKEGNKLAYAKDYDGAIKLYNEALQLKPNWDLAYYNRGEIYEDLGQYERAIQDFDEAIKLNPKYTDAYYKRAWLHFDLKNVEATITDYNKILQININSLPSWFEQSDLEGYLSELYLLYHYGDGNYKRAIEDYTKLINLYPDNALFYNYRAIFYRILGNNEKSLKDSYKSIELNPNYAKAYYWRGLCYQQLGDEEKAQADFAKAKELGYKG